MLETNDLNVIAQGACSSAILYITEALGFEEGAPIPVEKHQAAMVAMMMTIALIEVNLRKNLTNPAAWDAARTAISEMVEKISEKTLDKKPKGGIILGS